VAGCQTGCQNGLTTGWMFVYTIQPVVNQLYCVNGVIELTPRVSHAYCMLRPVQPVWPVHGSYTGWCGRRVIYMDRAVAMNMGRHTYSTYAHVCSPHATDTGTKGELDLC